MLRLLYKTLLVSIISGSLSTMNMMAFAEDSSSSNSANMTQAKAPEGLSRDSNGLYKKTEKHNYDKIEDPDMLASITMLAVGSIAGRMAISYKPLTTDVMVAAAGGAAFMVGEIMSNMSFKKKMEDMSAEITKSSDGKKDQAQIDRLNDLKKSYQEAKKTTSTKKTLQLAAAAAFAGAAATAVYLAFQEDAMDAACTGAISTANTGLASCVSAGATGVGATEAEGCGQCVGELANFFSTYKGVDIKSKVPGPSLAKDSAIKPLEAKLKIPLCQVNPSATAKAIIAGVEAACKPALSFKMMMQTSGDPVAPKADNGNKLLNEILFGGQRAVAVNYENWQSNESNSVLERVLNMMFPKAEASWLPLLGLGAASLATFFLISGPLAVAIDTQMYVPTNRAIAFGVLGGLSYMAANSSQNQMDKIDQNIAKIDSILNEMNALASGVKTNSIQEQQIKLAGFNGNGQTDVLINPNASVKTDCIASSGNSNCKLLTDQLKSMPGFSDLPDSFKGIASQSAQLGDGLSGTNVISGSTLSTAASLGAKQNAISKLLSTAQKKLNDQLVANGKSAIDFNKEQAKMLAGWNDQTAKALKSKNISSGDFLASIGSSPISGASKAAHVPAPESPKKFTGIASFGSAGGAPAKKDKAFDLDFKEAGAGDAAMATAVSGADSAKEEKYDIGQNDINTDSSESIFQMISNRYIKSGYPKLLEEIPVKK